MYGRARFVVRFWQRTGIKVTFYHHSHACKSMVNTVKERFGWKGDEANVQIRAANHCARHDHGGGGEAKFACGLLPRLSTGDDASKGQSPRAVEVLCRERVVFDIGREHTGHALEETNVVFYLVPCSTTRRCSATDWCLGVVWFERGILLTLNDS
jgi:hypothetical protein